jgi:hypothetical protein
MPASDAWLMALRDEVRSLAHRVVMVEARLDALQAIAVAEAGRVRAPRPEVRLARSLARRRRGRDEQP